MNDHNTVCLLIVDDEAELREMLAFDFERLGYRVITAGSGNEALQILKEEKVDLILSDVRMPCGDGLELLRKSRALGPEPPPMILITGFYETGLLLNVGNGVAAIFSKPFDLQELQNAVARTLLPVAVSRNARQHERFSVNLKILIRTIPDDILLDARMRSISASGLFVEFPGALPSIDTRVHFQFRTGNGRNRKVRGEGRVRWVREIAEKERGAGAGIEIDSIEGSDFEGLLRLLGDLRPMGPDGPKGPGDPQGLGGP